MINYDDLLMKLRINNDFYLFWNNKRYIFRITRIFRLIHQFTYRI